MGVKLLRMMTIGIIGMFCHINVVHAASIPPENIYYNSLAPSPFILGVIIVGGCIIITLSYVSWKKYKGEQVGNKSLRKNDKSVD
ncbi:sporulation protein YpjB [Oceanobacillus jeddahense]|uniref:Sporulation protein YpjB n=1 Tax=Oceanobacillus jeddahense TaxID=1462527 RepID=A0ABY5JL13_9BACI|nr:sporulation protein YpjB [Oceanobacillus jeddahense]UUI00981.1 sporulation protein YpjB [Oceanobacillus jeddahense]